MGDVNFGSAATTGALSVVTTGTVGVDSTGCASATATLGEVFSPPVHASSANGTATKVAAARRPARLRVAAYIWTFSGCAGIISRRHPDRHALRQRTAEGSLASQVV